VNNQYDRLDQKPSVFRSIDGMSVAEFGKLETYLGQGRSECERLSRS